MIEEHQIEQILLNDSIVPFHFNVADHSLPLNQFINTAKSTEIILNNFNKEFFSNKLKINIDVLTPHKGSLIEILGISVTAGYMAKLFWEFLQSDVGKAYIKGLTGHKPSYWAQKAGELTKEYLEDESGSLQSKVSKEHKKKIAEIIIAQITLGFLEKETESLEKTGLSKDSFHYAYKAKNQIYMDCIDNEDVCGLGFDFSPDFPILRRDFPSRIIELPNISEEDEDDQDIEYRVETPDLTVNSPNWKRDGRLWQASTKDHNDIAFTIDDENFWHYVKIKDITPDINDNMKVQWAYPELYSKPTKVMVLRVLTYNGKNISAAMSDHELKQVLYSFSHEEKNQPDFFDPVR